MEEEDDYDDFGDELEVALDDDEAGAGEAGPGLPTGPGLPSASALENAEPIKSDIPSQTSQDDLGAAFKTQETLRGPDAERARQMQEMLQSFTEDQLDRFEAHRRSSLNKKSMKRLLQAVTGHNPNTAGAANATILLCGVAKMFVGELVEEARVVAAEQNASGALLPRHVHEAFQRMHESKGSSFGISKRRRRV